MKIKVFNPKHVIILMHALRSFLKRNSKIAILIDADNVTPQLVKYAIEKTEQDYGKVKKRCIYGNWASTSLNEGWNDTIKRFRLQRVDNYSKSKGKNSTDICMTIGAMDLLHTEKIDIFILISSDSDFINLVHRLQDSGKVVIGYGFEANPNTQNSYDEYYIASRDKYQPPTQPKKENIHKVSLTEEKTLQSSKSQQTQKEKKAEQSPQPPQAKNLQTNQKEAVKKIEFEEVMREKFIKDLENAYYLTSGISGKVELKAFYEQYKKIDRVISFFHFNKFIEEVKNTKYFEFMPDSNSNEMFLKLKSPSVTGRIFPYYRFPVANGNQITFQSLSFR